MRRAGDSCKITDSTDTDLPVRFLSFLVRQTLVERSVSTSQIGRSWPAQPDALRTFESDALQHDRDVIPIDLSMCFERLSLLAADA